MSRDGRIWLSHTGLETLERCPRCFWLQYKRGIYQPEGIVSRLANRFDGVLKNYFNSFRATGELPPMVAGKIEGNLQNPFQEIYFARINPHYGFKGKLDECLINPQGQLIPVDFKTTSRDPREKEVLAAYQAQIDAYIYLLEENKLATAGFGYLIFVYPAESKKLHHGFPMIVHVVKVAGKPERTARRISQAIKVLEAPMPTASSNCDFCNWYTKVTTEVKAKATS